MAVKGYDAGTAWLQVLPSFENIDKEIKNGLQKAVDEINKSLSDAMPDGVKASAKATERASRQVGEQAGEVAAEKFAGHFADTLNQRLRNAFRALPEVVIDADTSDFDKAVAKVRKDVETLRGKKIGVDLTPGQAIEEASALSGRLRGLRTQTGDDDRLKVDLAQAADEVDAWVAVARAGGEELAREAKRAADEWNRIHQSALEENARRDRRAIEERNRLHQHALDEDLRRTYLILREQGRIQQQAIDEDLRRDWLILRERARIHERAIDEDLRRDWMAQQAMRKLHEQAIRENGLREVKARREITRQHEQAIAEDYQRQRKAVAEAARVAEQEFGRTFAGKIQAEVTRALQALPDIGMRPARDAAEQMVKDIRSRLDTLRGLRLGVDIDAGDALAELAAIQAQLTRLSNSNPRLDVHAEVTAAAARLMMVERIADRLDRKNINIAVNADASAVDNIGRAANFSLSRLESLTFIGLSMGTMLIPVAGAVASAIGFIGTAAVSSAAGIGVLALGFSGIGDAVKALNAYQQDAQKSALNIAAAQDRVASATEAVTSANRNLANTRASAASAARRAAQQVADAERAVADARRAAAEQVAAAAARVVDAQREAARADLDVRDAREGLTRAYRDAIEAMADLRSAVKRNSLDQRQAALDLAEAREELNKTLTNPRATREEREQAQITYERRVQQIDDLKRQGRELAREQQEANKKGIQGSEQVVAAQRHLSDAERRAADAQRSLADARAAVVRAQLDGARRVADAQRRLSEAHASQAEQQRQSAFQIAQAQQGVVAAQRQLRQAYEKTGAAGGAALEKLNEAMENLTPTGQRFAKFLFGLKDELFSLRAASADNMLPGVQAAIEKTLPMLPGFRDYVGRVAKSIGGLAESTVDFLRVDPTWRRFFDHVDGETVPTLERLYRIGRNTATGLLGLYMAFTGFNGDVGGGLEDLSERFARWSAELDRNQGFQNMLAYIREHGPEAVRLLGELVVFAARFVQAAAPIGAFLVDAFDALFSTINAFPLPVVQAAVVTMAALAGAILAVNAASRLASLTTGTWDKLTGAYDTVAGAMDRARDRSERLGRGMTRARSAGLTLRDGLASVGSFLSGPWGVAVGGAALAVGYFASQAEQQKQKVTDLADALKLLGDAYRQTRNLSSTAVKDVVAQSEELQGLINNAHLYGVAVEDIARAASGEVDAQQRVIAALQSKRDWYEKASTFAGSEQGLTDAPFRKEVEAIDTVIGALEIQFQKTSAAARAQEALNAAQQRGATKTPGFTEAQLALSEKLGLNEKKIAALTGLVNTFSDAQSTAADRANALRQAIESQTGAKIAAIEAEEAHARGLLGLTSTIESNEASIRSRTEAGELSDAQIAKQARSLSTNTEEGLRNRDALQEAAGAVRERYLADIESGVPMEEATKRFKDRIAKLIENTKNMGFDEKQAKELIEVYGNIDPSVTTVYKTKGFEQVFDELEKLQVAQWALKHGVDPKQAWKDFQQNKAQAAAKGWGDGYGVAPMFLADGGRVWGPGTATSDSIPARLSRGEFVQPAASVDFYGQGFMEAVRRRLLPRDLVPGFARGGPVTYPFDINTLVTRVPSMDEVRAVALKSIAGTRSSGGIGSADMMRLLRAVFPGLALYSGYRPGSRTPSGNLSYHGMIAADGDKGRAVDLPPQRRVFNWIHDNFFSATRELIWAGDANRNIWNGRHHRYSASLLANHGVAGQPNAHIHWAYDQGGYLPPGVTTVYNGTGKPEPVFTDAQFQDIAMMARNGHAEAREVHHWHFKDATLDHNRLQAWADRRDALARAGRRS